MNKGTVVAIVLVLIVLISVGVYFGTQKKDDDKKPPASDGAGGAGVRQINVVTKRHQQTFLRRVV